MRGAYSDMARNSSFTSSIPSVVTKEPEDPQEALEIFVNSIKKFKENGIDLKVVDHITMLSLLDHLFHMKHN